MPPVSFLSTWSIACLSLLLVGLLIVLPGTSVCGGSVDKTANESASAQEIHEQTKADAYEDTWRASGPKEVPGVKESQAVVHVTLSNFYFSRWNLALAEVELEEAIAYWPDCKIAHRNLCLVSFFQGNFSRAAAEFMMAVSLGDAIPLSEQERANLNRQALRLHYKRGIEHARYGRWHDAVAEFQWALTYEPRDPVVRRSLAFAYASLNDFEKAESEYELTFALDPTDAFAHADFAFLLSDQGNKEKATAQMSQAVKLAPAAAALHIDLGWMAEARGDVFTAASEFKKAINLSPRHAGLWVHLGRLMERQGRPDAAIEAYCKALKLNPQYSEAQERMARLKNSASCQI